MKKSQKSTAVSEKSARSGGKNVQHKLKNPAKKASDEAQLQQQQQQQQQLVIRVKRKRHDDPVEVICVEDGSNFEGVCFHYFSIVRSRY